jgi:prolyl-tRNA synthetase
LAKELSAKRFSPYEIEIKADVDKRDMRGGEKTWAHIKRGVPVRVEIGPRDLAQGTVFVGRRDQAEKQSVERGAFVGRIAEILEEMQANYFNRAQNFRSASTQSINSLNELKEYFADTAPGGFAKVHYAHAPGTAELLKGLKVSTRCLPLEDPEEQGTCIFTGQPSKKRVIIARAY